MHIHDCIILCKKNDNHSIIVAYSTIMMHVNLKAFGDSKMITPTLLHTTVPLVHHQCSQIGAKIVEDFD